VISFPVRTTDVVVKVNLNLETLVVTHLKVLLSTGKNPFSVLLTLDAFDRSTHEKCIKTEEEIKEKEV
jgi:hypothetical protein